MATFLKENIRNIAVVGHVGVGKTSLVEAILYYTKAIDRLGKVSDGTTVSDYGTEEINRKMSINLTMISVIKGDYKFNFLDAPGFFDFEGEMIAALSVCDLAVIVADANGQLSAGTEKTVKFCKKNNIPCLVFINGINKENSNFLATAKSIHERFNDALILEIPIMNGYNMIGNIDVLRKKATDLAGNEIAIPSELQEEYDNALMSLSEKACEANDQLMEKFLDGVELTDSELKEGIKQVIVTVEFIPIVAGVAVGEVNIGNLLLNIEELFPCAAQIKQREYTEVSTGERKQVICHRDESLKCQVFKVIVDPYVGKLVMLKVLSGKLTVGDDIYIPRTQKSERINALYTLKGKKQESVDVLYAGDIGAIAKINNIETCDTLCSPNDIVVFDSLKFPEPVIALSVFAEEKGQEEKVMESLAKLQEEDITLKLKKNVETNEMLICGMGETQLEIACKKIKNRYKVDASMKEPKIAYRETIKNKVEARGKHKKQSGGHGQYGDVLIRFEPCDSEGLEFSSEVVGGTVPKQYIPAVEKGLNECMKKGVLAGYPVVGLKAVLFDGSYHDVDSSEEAFKIAASLAFKDGLNNAKPVLLEPLMQVKVTVPESYLGSVLGDFNKRRGKILGMESENGFSVVVAEVPEAEIIKYATDLRSMTQGRGKFNSKFVRYEQVPEAIALKLIEKNKN